MSRVKKLERPLPLTGNPSIADMRRFLHFVEQRGECWYWKGHTDRNGYGQFWWAGKMRWAHRVACAWFQGGIHDEQHVHHEKCCTSHSCVNPAHLVPKSVEQNSRDGRARQLDDIPI